MGNKTKQWEVGEKEEFIRIQDAVSSGPVFYFKPRSYKDAELIVALHNTAVSINPSNPMAVAEGMENLYEACQACWDSLCENGRITEPVENVLKQALAIINKPAEKGE